MTLDEQIAIIQAVKDGKTVKMFMKSSGQFLDVCRASDHFDFIRYRYEIQREPMEIWVNMYPGVQGSYVHHNPETAKNLLVAGGRTVKFREVLDE